METLTSQLSEFKKDEHYRYAAFLNWVNQKDQFTDVEIEEYIELALNDPNGLMAGSAVKALFICPQISESQFHLIKQKLPKFGDWTNKLIRREDLKKTIKNEKLTDDILKKCVEYSKEFKENVLIELIINRTDNAVIIEEFTKSDYGKRFEIWQTKS